MKLKGKKINTVNFEYVVIPRPDGNIVFKASAVLNNDEFERICKEPEPPKITRPGQSPVPDFEDEDYKKALAEHSQRFNDWTILKSLSATESLEWESVKMDDPETWKNFKKELSDSGFSMVEVGKIIKAVWVANSLDERKLEEARKSFLASLPAEARL